MGAFAYLTERELSAKAEGDKLYVSPVGRLTDDDRAFIRAHKPELMAEVERRRRRDEVLMLLAGNPGVKYAFAVDTGNDPIVLAVAIRELATFEMTIPTDKYDPFAILQLFEPEP